MILLSLGVARSFCAQRWKAPKPHVLMARSCHAWHDRGRLKVPSSQLSLVLQMTKRGVSMLSVSLDHNPWVLLLRHIVSASHFVRFISRPGMFGIWVFGALGKVTLSVRRWVFQCRPEVQFALLPVCSYALPLKEEMDPLEPLSRGGWRPWSIHGPLPQPLLARPSYGIAGLQGATQPSPGGAQQLGCPLISEYELKPSLRVRTFALRVDSSLATRSHHLTSSLFSPSALFKAT